MKKKLLTLVLLVSMSFFMTSCYTYTFQVGDGPQTGAKVQGKNHYFIYGLAQGGQTDFETLAGNATDYQVTIQHTFVDGVINALTFGIYSPTTTIVQK